LLLLLLLLLLGCLGGRAGVRFPGGGPAGWHRAPFPSRRPRVGDDPRVLRRRFGNVTASHAPGSQPGVPPISRTARAFGLSAVEAPGRPV